MSKTVRKNSWICPFIQIRTWSWWGLFWNEKRPPSTIQGNRSCSFRLILLTNQPANQQTDKGEKTKHHWLVNISACVTFGLLLVKVVFIVCLIVGVEMTMFAIQKPKVWLNWEMIIYKNKIKICLIIIIMSCTNNVLSPNKLTGNYY